MSTYLITSVCLNKIINSQSNIGFVIFILVAFAQIVLTGEILSCFKSLNQAGFITLNIAFLIASIFTFFKFSERKFFRPVFKRESQKIVNALKKDKFLLFYAICFVLFIVFSISLVVLSGVNSYDALCYHLSRAAFFVSNSSLFHFEIIDVRNLEMPINSEILYSWILMFFKEDIGLGAFSFISYLLSISVLYNILGILHYSTRKKLWTVFVVSSLAAVIVETTSVETDLILASLVLSSIYLFLTAVKSNNNKCLIFFSTLAYALAIGTKTPSLLAFPSYCIICIAVALLYGKKNLGYKNLLKSFVLFFVANVLVFASFNYILNFLDFGNLMGAKSSVAYHSFSGGYKGVISNFVKYIFMMIDFSGLSYSIYLGPKIMSFQNAILSGFGISPNLGVISGKDAINNSLLDPYVGLGILSILLFIPALIISILELLKRNLAKNQIFFGVLSLAFVLNIFVLSVALGYMIFSIRFITFFTLISAPILVQTYLKRNINPFKWLISFYIFSYLVVISSNVNARPFWILKDLSAKGVSFSQIRDKMRCSDSKYFTGDTDACVVRDYIKTNPLNKRILVFPNSIFKSYILKQLALNGWKVDFKRLEDYDKVDISQYDYIVTNNFYQDSDYFRYFDERKNYYFEKNGEPIFTKFSKSPCVYLAKDSSVIYGDSDEQPLYVACNIPVQDFHDNGFQLVYSVLNPNGSVPVEKNRIFVYQNMSKSPISSK